MNKDKEEQNKETKESRKVMITLDDKTYNKIKTEADLEMRSIGNWIMYQLLNNQKQEA